MAPRQCPRWRATVFHFMFRPIHHFVHATRRAFEDAITDAEPDFVLGNLITGEGLVDNSQTDLLTHSAVGGVLAGVALVLAALGVIAFMVADANT